MTAYDSTFNQQFFDTDVFSVSADYTPGGGSASAVTVNFFNEGQEIELSGGVTIMKKHALLVRASEVSDPKQNETFEIDGTTYYIIKSNPDGEGVWFIELSENSV